MNEPTVAQFKRLYLLSYTLTNVMFQPIHIIRIDERNNNLFILEFSIRIVNLCKFLRENGGTGSDLSKQLIRSGISSYKLRIKN
jgi:hypothetical protein